RGPDSSGGRHDHRSSERRGRALLRRQMGPTLTLDVQRATLATRATISMRLTAKLRPAVRLASLVRHPRRAPAIEWFLRHPPLWRVRLTRYWRRYQPGAFLAVFAIPTAALVILDFFVPGVGTALDDKAKQHEVGGNLIEHM